MNMSEFDGPRAENDLSSLSCKERGLPDDFSTEDMAFAQELGSLFSLQDEEVPPYFVQTLLEPENPRFQAVERGFEQKTYARVFRRLKLRRRLFRSPQSSLHSVRNALPVRRPVMALLAACLLFMLATMIATGNSFASGLAVLWSGAHSGVLQVAGYPTGLTATASHSRAAQDTPDLRTKQVSLLTVQQQLTFSMYWPQSLPDNYSLAGLSLYNGSEQRWADGPIVELSYDFLLPGVKPHGNGRIAIREFKPTGKVLQVVQAGAAHQIEINNDGQGQVAIYVDGQWGQTTKVSQAWVFGTRSELIYEHNGIVFWIVGDQRDSINGTVLQNIASSMVPFNVSRAIHMSNRVDVLVSSSDSTWLFAGDVVYQDGPDGTSWSVVGQPNGPNPSPKMPSHNDSSINP
jgi:hypothetical protein